MSLNKFFGPNFKIENLLLALLVLFATIGKAKAQAPSAGLPVVKAAIANIKSSSTLSGDLFTASSNMALASVATAGLGAVGVEMSVLSEASGRWLVAIGTRGAQIAGVALIGALVFAFFDPSPLNAGELSEVTNYFLTAQGFQEYLKLPPEKMLAYAEREPRLGEMLIRISDGINQVKAR